MAKEKGPALLTKEEVAIWKQRLTRSEEWRKPEEKKWKRYLRYAKSNFENDGDPSRITVNLVHPHVRIIIPAIYSKNPDILVIPRRKDSVQAAKVMEQLLRYLIKELNLKGEMKLILLDAILMGHGWMKVGYQTDFARMGEDEDSGPIDQVKKVFKALVDMVRGGDAEEAEESTYHLASDERIIAERPWALRVSPFDVFVPAFSTNPHELPWIRHRTTRRLSDVKKSPVFKNIENLNPSASAISIIQDKASLGLPKKAVAPDEHEDYVTLSEIWDLTTNLIYTIADDNEDCLEVKENQYLYLDSRHCFEMLAFNVIPDQFYPISEIEPWEPQLMELNDIRTQMVKHRKRFNRRYVFIEGDFSPSALETMKNGEDNSWIPTSGDNAQTAVSPIVDAGLSQDVYQSEIRVKEDITNIGGITDYQKGSAAAGAKTATEASIVESQSRFRSEERLDVVGDFACRIIRDIAQICQNNMDQELVFPILGDDAVWFQKADKNTIQGEMIFDVIYGSTAAVNRDVEKQQFIQAYQMMSQDPYFDPVKVRTELLRKIGFINPNEWMRPDIAAMLKQAELQAIHDAMVNGGTSTSMGGMGSGGSPGGAVSSSGDMMGGIRRALNVTTPGGVGGGTMNGANTGLGGGGGTM